ncbi:MAG: neuromedin U [Candidatus Krumholzibacteria bacterium]|nr:neuromedin U [Candidatus Krumholzibacteria bacterium]
MKSQCLKTICTVLLLVGTLVAQTTATAQEADKASLAKAAQNPVASMISLPFQNNTSFGFGPLDGTHNVLNIQPVWPLSVSEKWNLITRTILPVVSQPALAEGLNGHSGLGDLTFTGFLSPASPGKVVWGAGAVVLAPTATDDALGAQKWGLGPSVVLLTMPGNWVVGSLLNNVWSVGGSGETDVNAFTWQYFVNYNMAGGWYLTSAPILTANWEAESGNRWTVPFGGGVGKIFKLGKQPMNGQVSAYYNVETPEFGSDWQLRVQLQLLFPK